MPSFFKEPVYRNKKITEAARGADCTFNSPDCQPGAENDTVVFCHSEELEDGKGGARKAEYS